MRECFSEIPNLRNTFKAVIKTPIKDQSITNLITIIKTPVNMASIGEIAFSH